MAAIHKLAPEKLAKALHRAMHARGVPNSFGFGELNKLYDAPSPPNISFLMIRHRPKVEAALYHLIGVRYTLTNQIKINCREIAVTLAPPDAEAPND